MRYISVTVLYSIVDKDTVRFSDIKDNINWRAIINEFTFNAGSDDQLVALVPRDDNTLVAFKDNSIYLVQDITETLGSPLLQLLTDEYGLVARLAAKRVGDDTIFLSSRGLFTINQTAENKFRAESRPISFDLESTFGKINKSKIQNSAMGFHNNELWLAVPFEGSQVNNKIIVYNTISKSFYGIYDLPGDDISVHSFVNADYNGERRMFLIDNQSRIFLCQEGDHDIANGRTVDIELYARTRTLFYGGLDYKWLKAVYFEYLSRDPEISINIITPGHNSMIPPLPSLRLDRTQYSGFAHAPVFDPSNINNDFDAENRDDYTVVLDDPDTDDDDPGLYLHDGIDLDAFAHHILVQRFPKNKIPNIQAEIINSKGAVKINSIGAEWLIGSDIPISTTSPIPNWNN